MPANISSLQRLPDPPRGWIRCQVCKWPVRAECYSSSYPPECVHNGGRLEPCVHAMAAPNLMEMESIPALRSATPGWNGNSPVTKPDVKKKQTMQLMKKKTGTGKEVGHEKQKECGDEKTFRESDGENGCCCCQEAGEVGFLLRAGCVS